MFPQKRLTASMDGDGRVIMRPMRGNAVMADTHGVPVPMIEVVEAPAFRAW
jgi:hypothetical protein